MFAATPFQLWIRLEFSLIDREQTLFCAVASHLHLKFSGVRTPGKSAKGAIHILELGIVPVQTGGFLMTTGELGILMFGFTFSSAMQDTAG